MVPGHMDYRETDPAPKTKIILSGFFSRYGSKTMELMQQFLSFLLTQEYQILSETLCVIICWRAAPLLPGAQAQGGNTALPAGCWVD